MRARGLRLSGAILAMLLASCGGGGGAATPTAVATPTPVPVTSFAGNWSGTYTITSCGHSGVFADANWCGTLSYTPLPINLVLTQSGSSVSGTLLQGTIATSVTGTVDATSHLILNGSTVLSGSILAEILAWNTTVSGNAMAGSWNTKWSTAGSVGSAQTVNTLSGVTKTSLGGGAVVRLSRRDGVTIQDIPELLRAQ